MHKAAFQQNLVRVRIILTPLMYVEAWINKEDEKYTLRVYYRPICHLDMLLNVEIEYRLFCKFI